MAVGGRENILVQYEDINIDVSFCTFLEVYSAILYNK